MKSAIVFAALAAIAAPAAADVARGEYLVETVMGCGNCHTPLGPEGFAREAALSGRLVEETDAFTAIAPNITPASRIADWSDEELARAIREGIRPDGTLIGPPMPFFAYRAISDEDLAAIVTYLRTIPAVAGDLGASDYRIPLPPAYGPPIETPVAAPAPGVTAEYGAYLSAVGHCMECHSPMTPSGPDWGEGFARGGFAFHGPWGTSVSANLTNHPDGLADYTDAEIVGMLEGRRPDGAPMLPPMPYPFLAAMSDDDKAALVLYLRSIPGRPDL
jgi:mono/diheme cytochrome c family protein